MTTRMTVTIVAATVGLSGMLLAAQQQDQETQPDVRIQAQEVEVERDAQRQARQLERRDLEETTFREGKRIIHRASAVIGMDVQNSAGKDLGDIHDLTLDDQGKVQYAAVSFGGFLGVGDKLFAVPWDAIKIQRVGEPGERGEWVALMEITEQELENARGFDKDNWPDMADDRWRTENDRVFLREKRETTLPETTLPDTTPSDPTTTPPRR